ncbi:DUF397 domain-containing protein [Streptomyces sp. HB132]|uniref:DUF397 domain-containing protein n=1 Tax=Streptomyces sp. HB132 TaxID=767388 RepID=UPI001960A477|nr:DUF397 domain-containing protein [Streptomyces sp. HB132]MBM7439023.1 hypothetical protein [Streptomyces sp. HB132]
MTERSIPAGSAPSGWRKSTYSGPESGSCVEVLDSHPSGVPVRDSKSPHGPALLLSAKSWAPFVSAVKTGRLSA